ncbi:MAG: hypothetical protein JO142_07965 [Burkholderiales bacterium]|nr:hypothetical protein [Burkholderiales bacterium]
MAYDKVFHIVCEGNTDLEVLRVVATAVGKANHEKYKVNPLFPPTPKANAGWPNLKNWCLQQASTLAGNLQAQAALAAQLLGAKSAPGAMIRKRDYITAALDLKENGARSAIVIQIDADIAHDLLSDIGLGLDMHVMPLCPSERVRICEQALDKWLGRHVSKKGLQIFYCITSLALENWILTLHAPNVLNIANGGNYDDIHFPDKILTNLGYASNKEGLKKDPPKYKVYGEKIVSGLNVSRGRSRSLDRYCSILTSV